MAKRSKSVVCDLQEQHLGVRNQQRHSVKILQKLLRQTNSTYTKLWESNSNKSIFYDGYKLYFNNYRTCYTVCGFKGYPSILYKLPHVSSKESIKDSLCCTVNPTGLVPLESENHRPCFLGLTAHNRMYRLDLETGKLLQEIHLSTVYWFRHISWENHGHTVILKSVRNHSNTGSRSNAHPQGVLCAFALFSVYPLRFVVLMEVSKKVFGLDAIDAMATDGLLIISYKRGWVKFYSLELILTDYTLYETKLGEKCDKLGGRVGQFPFGLPVNVDITECPPVLFEVRCGENDLAIGGFPWQYIIQTISNHDAFQESVVCTLDPPHSVENGLLKYGTSHIEPDRAIFHNDNSGRIVHYSSTEFRVLKLIEMEASYGLVTLFNISLDTMRSKLTTVSSSGRSIKRICTTDYLQRNLISFHYEDDLEILSMLIADPSTTTCDKIGGFVHFYDNDKGFLIKTIKLEETWEEDTEHNLILDCDVLIHIIKNSRGNSSCYIYKLNRLKQS